MCVRRATLPEVKEDPSCEHHLYWPTPPETILVVKKIRDIEVTEKFKIIVSFLVEVSGYIELAGQWIYNTQVFITFSSSPY